MVGTDSRLVEDVDREIVASPGAARVTHETATLLVASAFAVTMLGTTLPTPLYVLYQERLGFSTFMGTVIFAAYAAGVLAALLMFGRTSDRVGRRAMLLAALAAAFVSDLVFLGAGDVTSLLVGRVLSGVSAGIFTGTATATLVDLSPRDGRDRATLLATVATMAGLGSGPVVAGVLAGLAPLPLHAPYAVHLGLLCVVAPGIWRIPETAQGSTSPPRRTPLLQVPPSMTGTFATAALVGFVGFGVLGLFTAIAPTFLRQLLGVSDPVISGSVVGAVFVASSLGQLVLFSRLGRAAMPAGGVVLVVGLALLAVALGTASLTLLLAAACVAGLGQGISFRAGLARINEEAPADQRSSVASAFFTVMYVGIAVPVLGVGLGAGAWGLRAAGIGLCLGMAAVAVASLLIHHTSTRPACTGRGGSMPSSPTNFMQTKVDPCSNAR